MVVGVAERREDAGLATDLEDGELFGGERDRSERRRREGHALEREGSSVGQPPATHETRAAELGDGAGVHRSSL